jgi:riboflavin kinase/FMN adenylyltransferase
VQIYQDFNQVPTDFSHFVIAGAFFQLKKDCLRQLKKIISDLQNENLLFFDVFPGESLSEIKILLSAGERMLLLEQLGAQHCLSITDHEFRELLKSKSFSQSTDIRKIKWFCGLGKTGIDPSASSDFICESFCHTKKFLWHKKLGYLYPLTGKVVYGNKIGRTLGFPTANLRPEDSDKIIPPMGVYAGWVKHRGSWYKSMINIGIRPTLDLENVTIEAHIFDFSGNIYGQEISIHFQSRIRDEMRFPSMEVLKKQLHKDQKTALQLLDISDLFSPKDNFIIL